MGWTLWCFSFIILFSFQKLLLGKCHPHFTDEKVRLRKLKSLVQEDVSVTVSTKIVSYLA